MRQDGPNELPESPRPAFWRMVLDQFNNFIVIILIVASVVSAVLGETIDAAAIMAIVLLNAVLGVVQERRAEEALAALRRLAAPEAQVVRDGHRQTIAGRLLVPGDIVLLEAGNYVPADVRLFETANLRIEEAALTGESVAVQKDAKVVLSQDVTLGDRLNTAFMGTLVSYGRDGLEGFEVAVDVGEDRVPHGPAQDVGRSSLWMRSRMPLMNRLDSFVPNFFAISIASLIATFGGTSWLHRSS